MKTCIKCGHLKAYGEFSRRHSMADGYRNECKLCMCAYKRAWKQNLNESRRIELMARVREMKRSPEVRAKTAAAVRLWNRRNPHYSRAHNMACEAVRKGILVSPAKCQECSSGGPLEKHHSDYSQPLLVTWLCRPCHRRADILRRQEIANHG